MDFLSVSMAKVSCGIPTPFSKFACEAITIYKRSGRLLLPITLLSLLSSSALFIADYHAASPVLVDLSINLFVLRSGDADGLEHAFLVSAVRDCAKALAAIELAFAASYFFASSFLSMATVHVAAAPQPLTAGDLLWRIKRSWKAALSTQLLVFVFNFCCVILSSLLLGFFFFIFDDSMAVYAAGAAVTLPLLYFYAHLSLVGTMGIIISILEEGCHGVEALVMALELTHAKRRQGAALALVMVAASASAAGACAFSTALVVPVTPWPLANGVISMAASAAAGTATLAAFTAFYHDCKGSHGDKDAALKLGPFHHTSP